MGLPDATPAKYQLDQSWEQERERLADLERLADPVTTDHLRHLGVSQGWRCLEVGAGAGSIARWLADAVGAKGQVLAIDLETALLEPLRSGVVEVRRADILVDDLPGGFDLVHARLVVGHLEGNRATALRRMVKALRPGGWLLVEEFDFVWTEFADWPGDPPQYGPLTGKVWRAMVALWKAGGYDGHWARTLASDLRAAGLSDVEGEARARICSTGSLDWLSVERFREQLVESGALTLAELDAYRAACLDERYINTAPLQTSVWGRAGHGS